jgi:hypothetical protein
MASCVIITIARKTSPCRLMLWLYTTLGIPHVLYHLLIGLVVRSGVGLHPLVLDGVAHWDVRALDLVNSTDVAVGSLYTLARLKEVMKDLVEDLDVGELSGWIQTLDPHQVPTQNNYPDLVPEGGFERILVGGEPVAGGRLPCLQDPKIHPINQHEAVVAYVAILAHLEVNLWWRGGGGVK